MTADTIVTATKSRFDERARRKRIREVNLQKLIVTHNGGMFKVTPELFAMLSIFSDPEIILEDAFGNPISCERVRLLDEAKQRYREIMNAWSTEFRPAPKS